MQICLIQHRAQIALLLSGLVFCSIHARANASEGPPPTLNPKSHASPSGKYSLFVNPSDLYGRDKASYRLTLEGREVWSAEKPSDLSADRDGGVVVEDFQGDPLIVRMNADGTVRAQVKPRSKDGRTFRLSDSQVAPDGALWVSDGHALFRLGESGEVDRVLGEAPDPLRLDQAAAVILEGSMVDAVPGSRGGALLLFDGMKTLHRFELP
jgi:hypothetical protein